MIQLASGLLSFVLLMVLLLFSLLDKKRNGKQKSFPRASFIVPCYNDACSVSQTLESIYEVAGENVDVIVVNDKSTDNSREVLEKLSGRLNFRLINNPENIGKSKSLNSCVHLAVHDIVLFIDADVIVNEKSYIDAMSRLMNERVAAVSCPYTPMNKGFIELMQQVEYNMLSLIQKSYNIFSAISLWGGFIGVKKEYFLEVGGFSVNAITEDMDLAFKLNKNGRKVEQSRFPVCTYVPDNFRSWFKQKLRWSSGGFQCYVNHHKVWTRNPIHVFFSFSYCALLLSSLYILARNLIFLENSLDFWTLFFQIPVYMASLRFTGLLYALYLMKDVLWFLLFTLLTLPYVLPLVTEFKKMYYLLIIIPFSILYVPAFSFVTIFGILLFIYRYSRFKEGMRAW